MMVCHNCGSTDEWFHYSATVCNGEVIEETVTCKECGSEVGDFGDDRDSDVTPRVFTSIASSSFASEPMHYQRMAELQMSDEEVRERYQTDHSLRDYWPF